MMAITELRFIASVAGNSATVKTLEPAGRDWTYEVEVDADVFYAIVDDDADGDYTRVRSSPSA